MFIFTRYPKVATARLPPIYNNQTLPGINVTSCEASGANGRLKANVLYILAGRLIR